MLFYVRERDNHLTRIQNTINSSQFGMYIGGSPFSNNVHKEYRYRVSTSFHFGEKNGPYSIKAVVAEEYSQIIEKLTGRILHNYKNTRTMKFIDNQPLSEQPKKYDDEVRLPVKGLKYNVNFWDGLKDHRIGERVRKSLNKWGPLESQFATTDGGIEVDRKMEKTTFNKKDQRKQSKTKNVEQFIEDLINNRYQADYPPALSWEDIPALMEIADNTKAIDRFPRNILSRVYVGKCQVGIVAMWLIDSIRKNEGRKPRKAWYISPAPLLEDEEDREKTSSRSGQFIPNNTDKKLADAYNGFVSWWETAEQLGAGKAKRINPLDNTGLNWVFRD